MPPKINPKNLNPLQLRTLAIFQRVAGLEGSTPGQDGSVILGALPHPHGDHFHLGGAVVMTRDASGIGNEAVWNALARKGLIEGRFPQSVTLLAEGIAYPIGPVSIFIEHSDH